MRNILGWNAGLACRVKLLPGSAAAFQLKPSCCDGRQQHVRRPSDNGYDGRQQRVRRPSYNGPSGIFARAVPRHAGHVVLYMPNVLNAMR